MNRSKDRRKTRRLIDQRAVAIRLETNINENANVPVMARLGKTQCRVLLSMHKLGREKSYITNIKEHVFKRYKEEINIGQLSNIAKALKHFELIEEHDGGCPTGRGRPVKLYTVTPLGYLAMAQTAEYIETLQAQKDDTLHAQENETDAPAKAHGSSRARPH